MRMARFGHWLLGMYPPGVPADLRLTDVEPPSPSSRLAEVHSKVEITPNRRSRLASLQQRQHDRRNELQEHIGAREIAEAQEA